MIRAHLHVAMASGQWRSSCRHRDTRPLTSDADAATATAVVLQTRTNFSATATKRYSRHRDSTGKYIVKSLMKDAAK